jgi:hypothetical protein
MNAKAHLASISYARLEYQSDTRRGIVFGRYADTLALPSVRSIGGNRGSGGLLWESLWGRSPSSSDVPLGSLGLLVHACFCGLLGASPRHPAKPSPLVRSIHCGSSVFRPAAIAALAAPRCHP